MIKSNECGEPGSWNSQIPMYRPQTRIIVSIRLDRQVTAYILSLYTFIPFMIIIIVTRSF